MAVQRNPEINATWDQKNQEIIRKDYVNLGIATATGRGLVVSNIRNAQAKTLPELSSSITELVH